MQNLGETKNAIIYCRVSSKDQLEGTSLDMQEKCCLEYAQKQGWDVSKVFIERGESAKTANRTEFNKALAFCSDKKSRVGFFVVYKIDRFARNQDDHAMVRALLKKSGVVLRSVTEQIDESSGGRLMEGMLSAFAEFDNNIRAERTKGGMMERVKQGVWVWKEPLGYHRPSKGNNIEPDPEVAPYIRLAFEEWSKGVYTYQSLADFLSDRGFRTRENKNPRPQLIEKMIKNPIYYGFIKEWGGHQGSFEPIITKELFLKCQKEYKDSIHIAARSANNPLYPLRGCKCAQCKESITASASTGRSKKKYDYYHHASQKCVRARSIPKETFEQLFVEFLNDITPTGQYEKLFKRIVLDTWKKNYEKFHQESGKVRKDIDSLEQERLKIFDYHRSGKYTDDEFLEQKNIYNLKIEQKRRLLADQSVEEFNMEEALDYCFDFVRTTAKSWQEADYQSKLRLQKLICKEDIEFDGVKFGTAKLSQVYALNQEYQNEKSNLVALRRIELRLPG